MSKRTDQEEYYYRARIDREAQKLLDKIKREVEASPIRYTWADAPILLSLALLMVGALVSVAGCLRTVFKW